MRLIAISLYFILFFLSRKQISHLEPAGVFSALWLFLIGCCLLLSHYITIYYYGINYILLLLIFFSIGSLIVKQKSLIVPRRRPGGLRRQILIVKQKSLIVPRDSTVCFFERKKAFILVCLITILGFIKPVYDLVSQGFNILLINGIEEVLEMNEEMSVQRYSGVADTSFFTQLLGVFVYAAPLMGGFCLPHFRGWKRAVCVISIFPALFGSLTQGAKMGLLTGAFIFASGYIVSCRTYGKELRLHGRSFIKVAVLVLAFFAILILSMVFRTGQMDEDTVLIVLEKFVSYALGSVPCFDYWFTFEQVPIDGLTFGAKTFWGISNFLGILRREDGIYQEMISFGQNGLSGYSNVFSVFRTIVEDFGYVIPFILMFILGACAERIYCALPIMKNARSAYQTLLIGMYAFIFWSFVASFFAYTSYIAMIVLVWIMLSCIQSYGRKPVLARNGYKY